MLRDAVKQGGTLPLLAGQHRAAKKLQNFGLGRYHCTGSGHRGSHAHFVINDEGRSYVLGGSR
jgi:hypothetical protein